IHAECVGDYLHDILTSNSAVPDGDHSRIDGHPSTVPQSVRLDQGLESLFSVQPLMNESRDVCLSPGNYVHSAVRIKHLQSIQRALNASGRTLQRLPDVFFTYASPHKSIRKGELFDAPLRLDLSSLLDSNASMPISTVPHS